MKVVLKFKREGLLEVLRQIFINKKPTNGICTFILHTTGLQGFGFKIMRADHLLGQCNAAFPDLKGLIED